jgi:two-component system alkaline phosphatase synthesis response regulator PhoP
MMDHGRKLLVVEDDSALQELLKSNLQKGGWEVTMADSGEAALLAVTDLEPDLILLDIGLPGVNGFQVCRQVRSYPKTSSIPIIMLSAAGQEADVVAALDLGADDFVQKPFGLEVLRARMQAVMRRSPDHRADPRMEPIQIHGILIDPLRFSVRVEGRTVHLTRTDFEVLLLFAREPGRVFSRRQIIEAGHGEGSTISERSVDVQIVGLRRKIGQAGKNIETVRGVGYRLKESAR